MRAASTGTWKPFVASSRLPCVRGEVRLSWSACTVLANSGPALKTKLARSPVVPTKTLSMLSSSSSIVPLVVHLPLDSNHATSDNTTLMSTLVVIGR